MKRIIFAVMIVAAIVGCSQEKSKCDQAGENAIQYLYEQMTEKREDVKSVEIVKEDSVLGGFMLSILEMEVSSEYSKYLFNEISTSQFREFHDSMRTLFFDIANSWIMDKNENDSLKQLLKYRDKWRKAYLLEVTMKSNKKLQDRVCMDSDGVTPLMTIDESIKDREYFWNVLRKCNDI